MNNLNWYGESFIGNYRKVNEDKYIYLKRDNISLAVVCDGMGGHKFGELASSIAINIIKKKFMSTRFKNNLKSNDIFEWLENSIYDIFSKMYHVSENDKNKMDMGTTFLAVIIIDHNIYAVNIGDSRLYLYNGYDIKQVTKDQNMLNLLGWQRCKSLFANKNVFKLLTSALGPNKKLRIDRYKQENFKGIVLLSTDGFHDYVYENEICSILSMQFSLTEKVQKLINTAVQNISSDNITVLLIKVI